MYFFDRSIVAGSRQLRGEVENARGDREIDIPQIASLLGFHERGERALS